MGAWRDTEKVVAQGKLRSIGLSNFESERLEEVCEAVTVKPAALQVECHPYYQQNDLIILRWHIQARNVIFPKSTNPQHIRDNFDIFDFALTAEEMDKIAALDCGKRFYTATLEEQERNFSHWTPAD